MDLKINDKRNDEKFRDLKSSLESFQCVCWVDLCVNVVVDMHIMRKHPHYRELRKTITFFVEFYKVDRTRGLWFFVKLVKQSMGS